MPAPILISLCKVCRCPRTAPFAHASFKPSGRSSMTSRSTEWMRLSQDPEALKSLMIPAPLLHAESRRSGSCDRHHAPVRDWTVGPLRSFGFWNKVLTPSLPVVQRKTRKSYPLTLRWTRTALRPPGCDRKRTCTENHCRMQGSQLSKHTNFFIPVAPTEVFFEC